MAAIEEHVYAGITFPGRHEVSKIAQELQRQKAARTDGVVRSDKLELKVIDQQLVLKVPLKETHLVPLTNTAWTQLISSWMELPKRCGHYRWLFHGSKAKPSDSKRRKKAVDSKQNWGVACQEINTYMREAKEYRMVRLMSDEKHNTYCRAFLSDGF